MYSRLNTVLYISAIKSISLVLLIIFIIAVLMSGQIDRFMRHVFSSTALPSLTVPTFRMLESKMTAVPYTFQLAGTNAPNILAVFENAIDPPTTYFAPNIQPTSVPVILFHGILDKPDGSTFNISQRQFTDMMFTLKRAGYHTITLDDLYRFKRKEITLPARSFVITFDDGRTDSFVGADPVLRATGFTANMYVISKYSLLAHTNNYYLASNDLQQMEESGYWSIQAHARNAHDANDEDYVVGPNGERGHFFSNRFWIPKLGRLETIEEYTERVQNELTGVKSDIIASFPAHVMSFAFPFGDYGQSTTNDPAVSEILLDSARKDYSLVMYQNAGGYRYSQIYAPESEPVTNSYTVRRITVDSKWSGNDLLHALEVGTTKTLPYHDTFTSNLGWIPTWGYFRTAPETGLSFRAIDGEEGAAAILDGSRPWKDYTVSARVQSPTQTTVYLLVRFQDDMNNAGCSFGKDFIHIDQTVQGTHTIIRGVATASNPIPPDEIVVTARVSGRHITCSIGAVSIESDYLDDKLKDGGIGFKMWDQEPGKSSLILKQVDVTPVQASTTDEVAHS